MNAPRKWIESWNYEQKNEEEQEWERERAGPFFVPLLCELRVWMHYTPTTLWLSFRWRQKEKKRKGWERRLRERRQWKRNEKKPEKSCVFRLYICLLPFCFLFVFSSFLFILLCTLFDTHPNPHHHHLNSSNRTHQQARQTSRRNGTTLMHRHHIPDTNEASLDTTRRTRGSKEELIRQRPTRPLDSHSQLALTHPFTHCQDNRQWATRGSTTTPTPLWLQVEHKQQRQQQQSTTTPSGRGNFFYVTEWRLTRRVCCQLDAHPARSHNNENTQGEWRASRLSQTTTTGLGRTLRVPTFLQLADGELVFFRFLHSDFFFLSTHTPPTPDHYTTCCVSCHFYSLF